MDEEADRQAGRVIDTGRGNVLVASVLQAHISGTKSIERNASHGRRGINKLIRGQFWRSSRQVAVVAAAAAVAD